MDDSDSDIEVLEEVVNKSKKPLRKSASQKKYHDIDDIIGMEDEDSSPFVLGKWAETCKKTPFQEVSDVESVSTDVIEPIEDGCDDDLESLPSISPPHSPRATYSNSSQDNNEIMDIDISQESFKDKKGKAVTSKEKLGRDYSIFDRDAQEIDDFFQGSGYASLGDYLADVEGITGGSKNSLKPPPVSKVSSGSKTAKDKAKSKTTNSNSNCPTELQNVSSIKRSKNSKNSKTQKAGTTVSTTNPQAQPPQTKAPKPGEASKMMILQIAEDVMSDSLGAKLIDKEMQFKIIENPLLQGSIFFERNVHYNVIGPDLKAHPNVVTEMDTNLIIIFNIEKGLKLLNDELETEKTQSSSSESLTNWIKKIQATNSGKRITLLIEGLESYLRKVQRQMQKEYREKVLNGNNPDTAKRKRKAKQGLDIQLSRTEIQCALIGAQLHAGINYRCFENVSELSTLLFQYTKAIGEAPYKREKMNSTEFDWYAVSDCVGGIPVDEDGKGMRSLWISQLCQFPNVGQESALAIARVYGSPLVLYNAYRRCSTVEEGKTLLANIQVTMGVGPLAKTRRLGPEASKKIYRFFTTTDGERYIST